MRTHHLSPAELAQSPLTDRSMRVTPDAVEAFATQARDTADALASAADTAEKLTTSARHAARLLSTFRRESVKELAPRVGLTERVMAQILTEERDVSPDEALLIAKALTEIAQS